MFTKFMVIMLVNLLARISLGSTEDPPRVYSVIYGTKNQLLCDYSSPDVQTEWRRADGRNLPTGSFQQNGQLTIDPTGYDAVGYYEYVVQLPDRNASQAVVLQVFLEVIDPPRITFNLNIPISQVRSGDFVVILCLVSGAQPMLVSWHKANTEMFPDQVKVYGRYLVFPRISKQDEGQYICRASNRAGNTTRTAEVILRN